MNNIKVKILTILTLITYTQSSIAQQVKQAGNTSQSSASVQLCESYLCNTLSFHTDYTPTCINADMVTITSNGSSPSTEATFGTSSTNYLWGIAFSGITNTYVTDAAGITVYSDIGGNQVSLPLPYYWGTLTGVAHDPDVAVGSYYNSLLGQVNHFALAVYELDGEIYLEHYDVYTSTSSTYTYPREPHYCSPCLTYSSNNPLQISNANGTAGKPHIEVWHESTVPSSGNSILADRYAIVWEQEDMSGNLEVWGTDGAIDGASGYPTINSVFYIYDGKQPDVVAVTANYDAASPYPDLAYVTYLSRNGRNVELSDWEYNTSSPSYITQLNLTSTQNDDEFLIPRISGPMYFDYGSPSSNDPLAVVVVNDNDGNSTNLTDKVSAFKYYDPSVISNPVRKLDISDYNNSDGFSSNSQIAIMPAITGVGEQIYNLKSGSVSAAYQDYPVVFYSDLVTNQKNFSWNGGDFYTFGVNRDYTVTDPVLYVSTPDEYWENNYDEIEKTSTFNLAADPPRVAVATSNNTGYDLLTTYFEGDASPNNHILYRFTGTTNEYDFKPGRSADITEASAETFHAYPNPVATQLNIVNAAGAGYTVMDMTGKTLSTGTLGNNKAAVNVSNLASGMYIMHISKDGITEKLKFVKQ